MKPKEFLSNAKSVSSFGGLTLLYLVSTVITLLPLVYLKSPFIVKSVALILVIIRLRIVYVPVGAVFWIWAFINEINNPNQDLLSIIYYISFAIWVVYFIYNIITFCLIISNRSFNPDEKTSKRIGILIDVFAVLICGAFIALGMHFYFLNQPDLKKNNISVGISVDKESIYDSEALETTQQDYRQEVCILLDTNVYHSIDCSEIDGKVLTKVPRVAALMEGYSPCIKCEKIFVFVGETDKKIFFTWHHIANEIENLCEKLSLSAGIKSLEYINLTSGVAGISDEIAEEYKDMVNEYLKTEDYLKNTPTDEIVENICDICIDASWTAELIESGCFNINSYLENTQNKEAINSDTISVIKNSLNIMQVNSKMIYEEFWYLSVTNFYITTNE